MHVIARDVNEANTNRLEVNARAMDDKAENNSHRTIAQHLILA